jgi:hypothetical protein
MKTIICLVVVAAIAAFSVKGISASAAKPIENRQAQIEAVLEQSK